MIDCKRVAEDLLRFRDGELSEAETEHLRQHLHLCPPCMDLSAGYETVVEILARLKPVNLPDDFLARMKQAMCRADRSVEGLEVAGDDLEERGDE